MKVPGTAMVMAAGLGTRMRPLTNDRPKPLVTVAGKPLIDYAFDKLRLAGVRKAVVNIHYLPEVMEAYVAAGVEGLEISISDERELLLETGGGMVKALPLIADDPFYAINSDAIWIDEGVNSLSRLADAWDDTEMDALLLLVNRDKVDHRRGGGDFSLDDHKRLIRKRPDENAPFIYTGVQLISHRLLRETPAGPFSTNILWDRAIAEGRAFGLELEGQWFDIGTPEAIAPMEKILLAHG
jgi:N-acetyl-alpha-D-muramate 1-phosphate uridylyltransferase